MAMLPRSGFGLRNAQTRRDPQAGIKKSAHGLRKNAAAQAANNGATVAELEAIFGWEGGRMAAVYTKSADRDALALRAMTKLSRTK